jgi:anti-sigma factor RsiW
MQDRTVGSPKTIAGKTGAGKTGAGKSIVRPGRFGAGTADVIAAQPMLGRAHGSRPALFRSLLTVSLIAGGLSAALIGSGVTPSTACRTTSCSRRARRATRTTFSNSAR